MMKSFGGSKDTLIGTLPLKESFFSFFPCIPPINIWNLIDALFLSIKKCQEFQLCPAQLDAFKLIYEEYRFFALPISKIIKVLF